MAAVYCMHVSPLGASQVSKKHVKKEVSKQIHEKAAPFIKWLREAEEETSEEEEEEDGVEVVYSNQSSGKLTIKPEPEPVSTYSTTV